MNLKLLTQPVRRGSYVFLILTALLAVCKGSFAAHLPAELDQQTRPITEVLAELSESYQVFFTYDYHLLETVEVDFSMMEEESVVNAVNRLLKPTGFRYEHVEERFFVIYRDTKKGQKAVKKILKKFNQIEDLEVKAGGQMMTGNQPLKAINYAKTVTAKARIEITGTVTNEDGEPLEGATVRVKGKNLGDLTDAEGKFSLEVSGDKITLVVSYIGFKSKEVLVNGQSNLAITLETDLAMLDEVVVIGYGTQKSSDVTGSIVSIRSDKLEQIPVASFDQKLQGQVAGMQVSQNSGAPGGGVTVRVRGAGSATSGNEPLYVIDGVPITNTQNRSTQGLGFAGGNTLTPLNPLASLNPNDIESIQILKDASATAIYGSRGANGVVIITTKKGSSGKAKIQVDMSRGWQTVTNSLDLLNGQEAAELRIEARRNGHIQRGGGPAVFDADPTAVGGGLAVTPFTVAAAEGNGVNTSWLDEIFRTAPITNIQVSARGGNEKSKYYVSGNYFEQEGVIIGSGLERFTARINVDNQINDQWRFSLNLSPSFLQNDVAQTGGRAGNGNVIQAAANFLPFYPVRDENGQFVGHRASGYTTGARGNLGNPVSLALNNQINLSQGRILGSGSISFQPIEGLTFKTNIGTDLNFYRTHILESSLRSPLLPDATLAADARTNAAEDLTWLIENTVTYQRTFGEDHSLNLLAGQTAQKAKIQRSLVRGNNIPNDDVPYASAGIINGGDVSIEEWALVSYLGRVNYVFQSKYFITGSIRTDGSSRFSSNNRYGVFPSFAAAWKLSEEAFLENVSWVEELKLRGGWGRTGNFEIGNYSPIARLGTINYASGSSIVQGAIPISPANDDLTWETTDQVNVGIDLSLFRGRVSITADYYNRRTKDMLLFAPVPTLSGFGAAIQNIGEVENKGFEFALHTVNISNDDLYWDMTFNISRNRNEVLALTNDGEELIARDESGAQFKTVVGMPMSQMWGWVSDGIFMNQEEVDAHATQTGVTRAGDRRFVDLNNDGVINGADQTFIGNPIPDYVLGLSSTLRYKGFDCSFLFSGMIGNDILNITKRGGTNANGNFNQFALMRNRWRSEAEPGDGNTHRVVQGVNPQNNRFSSYYIEDASFLRLRNISLGYTFNQSWVERIKMDQLRVYVTGTNLLTITSDEFNGLDPEANSQGSNALVQGSSIGSYPLPRVLSVGFTANF